MRLHDEEDTCGDEGYEPVVCAFVRSAEPMPADARAAVRERLMAAVRPAAVPVRIRLLRPAIALATTGALLGGVSYAAAASRPGEVLFGLKSSMVSTVRSAQQVLAEHAVPVRVPAVLKPLEAPAAPRIGRTRIPEIRQAVPKKADTTRSPQIEPGKSKGRGNGKTVKPKGRGNSDGAPSKQQTGRKARISRR